MKYPVLILLIFLNAAYSEKPENKIYIIADLKSCEKFISVPLYVFDFLEYGECQNNKLEILLKSNRAKDKVLFRKRYKTGFSVKHYSYDYFKSKKYNNDNIVILNNQDSIVFSVNTGNVSNIDSLKTFLKSKLCE